MSDEQQVVIQMSLDDLRSLVREESNYSIEKALSELGLADLKKEEIATIRSVSGLAKRISGVVVDTLAKGITVAILGVIFIGVAVKLKLMGQP